MCVLYFVFQQAALEDGLSVDHVHSLSRIDRWFLCKLRNIAIMKKVSLGVPCVCSRLSRYIIVLRAFPSARRGTDPRNLLSCGSLCW